MKRRNVVKHRDEPVVLVVDDDLGFVCWLSELLNEAGHQVAAASTTRDAAGLVKNLNPRVELVIVNPGLPGSAEMIKTLSRTDAPPKVVVIQDSPADAMGTIHGHATLERPSRWDHIARRDWLGTVKRVLRKAQEGGAA